MTEASTPIWRCKACDKQFAEPETWPPADHLRRRIPATELQAADWKQVCPRCHSSSIERWR